MTEDFVTVDGSIPAPLIADLIENGDKAKGCDEVTLTVTFLVRNGEFVVARCNLDSPYWLDEHDRANGIWSLCLPRYEWAKLLCTLLQSQFMKVIAKREELLA